MWSWLTGRRRRPATETTGAAPRGGGAALPGDDVALTIVQDGRRRDVTTRELAVGNKLAGDALLQVLVERGLVTHEEVRAKLQRISEELYRPGGEAPKP